MAKSNSMLVYDPSMPLAELVKFHENGGRIMCSVCNTELSVVLDGTVEASCHPGIYCEENREHVSVLFEIRSPDFEEFWDQFG